MAKKTPNDKEKLICDLYNDGYGTLELSKRFNLNRATIQRCLQRNNIKLRKTSPYKKKYNIHFFNEYSDESCYWAGFILADGCIRTDRDAVEIHLKESDKEHLLKFAKAISFTGNLVYDKYSKAYSISIAGKWFPQTLLTNYGIKGQKSLNSQFPTQLPIRYYSSFIRGIFDGDGCITETTCPTISIIGTESLNDSLRKIFSKLDIKLKSGNDLPPLISTQNEFIKFISYSGKNAKKILDWLYLNSSLNLRLDRKFQKYINLFGE